MHESHTAVRSVLFTVENAISFARCKTLPNEDEEEQEGGRGEEEEDEKEEEEEEDVQ